MSEATVVKSKTIDIPLHNSVGNKANHGALRSVRAKIIEVDIRKSKGEVDVKKDGAISEGTNPNPSESLPEDPFLELAYQGRVIEPPFDMLTLSMLPEHSSELNQCIEAMETNIEGYGHRFVSRLRTDDIDKSDDPSPEAKAAAIEQAKLINFFTNCTRDSFIKFRRKLRKDLETTGNSYFEVIRDKDGNIQGFTHLPAYQMRLGRIDEEDILVSRNVLEIQPDKSVRTGKVMEYRRFRKYVQSRAVQRRTLHSVEGSGKIRWFKEFGDVRKMNKMTGEYETDTKKVDDNNLATEVYHSVLYSARSPYGLPRYIGNLLSIFGDRAAEEINYITFRNNNIPSMMLLVSNGQLTEGTIGRLTSFVESQIQGSDNYSKFVIVEGEPFGDEGEDGSQVKIDVKPMTDNQHKDALFQNYSSNNQDKIRRAFRLPPIFVGRSSDYSRSTAEASRRLADEQIFMPERDEFDNIMNRHILPEMGVIYHRFKSNSPTTTDNALLVGILAGAEKTGGMTPRIARAVLENILGMDLPAFPKDFAADVPFSVTMAEAVKNQADPTQPGQQVTALKALELLGIVGEDTNALSFAEGESLADVAKKVMTLQGAMEMLWRKQGGVSEGSASEG